jgi:hypothetical protein
MGVDKALEVVSTSRGETIPETPSRFSGLNICRQRSWFLPDGANSKYSVAGFMDSQLLPSFPRVGVGFQDESQSTEQISLTLNQIGQCTSANPGTLLQRSDFAIRITPPQLESPKNVYRDFRRALPSEELGDVRVTGCSMALGLTNHTPVESPCIIIGVRRRPRSSGKVKAKRDYHLQPSYDL